MEQIHNLEVVLDFVERWNKGDKEQEVAEAAGQLEAMLATYPEHDL